MAAGLALLLVSWMSMGTVSTSSAQLTRYNMWSQAQIPAGNFWEACCYGNATPKEVVEFRAFASNGPLNVSIYKVSPDNFAPLYSYSGFGNISRLSAYLAANQTEVLGSYSASSGMTLDIQYYPKDIEPLLVVVVNPTGGQVNITYWEQTMTVQVNPNSGFEWSGLMLVAGTILLVAGLVWKRNSGDSQKPEVSVTN